MDTMFPGLIVEKYTISMWRFPTGWWITVRAYDGESESEVVRRVSWQIPIDRLKVEDLYHLVLEVEQEVAANTE